MLQTLQEVALRLDYHVGQITPEEFRWQDANYDRDSALGRELLFLIADNQWIRATSETIDITRSDAVDTTIRIDVDLEGITHEAFRGRAGQLWLPVLVLPPLQQQRLPEPDPFSTLTVTDASGSPIATLPNADMRHRVAAAMTDIILNVEAWLPDASGPVFGTTRDHRLLLSAAIYRLLRNEHVPADVLKGKVPPRQTAVGPLARFGRVRRDLGELVEHYSHLLLGPAGQESNAANRGTATARLLTERAVMVLRAFAESAIVVVVTDCSHTPTVLTVAVPGRALHQAPTRPADLGGPVTAGARRWVGPGLRRWLHPVNWILPRASLQIDLLLPSADADRLVQVNLPDGVSPDPSRPLNARAELEVRTEQLTPVRQLYELTHQMVEVSKSKNWSMPLIQSLADLVGAKADAVRESLRDHKAGVAKGEAAITTRQSSAATREFRTRLDTLSAALADISAMGLTATARRKLAKAWAGERDGDERDERPGAWLQMHMQRRTVTDTVSPDIVVARSRMIEDVSQRGAPTEARMQVHIAVTDSEYFSTSQFSGWMSLLLMAVVLVFYFFLGGRTLGIDGSQVSAEVLAFVLTLFSAIQIGRIERPDRSTVRGMLAPAGNPLIVASILPTVILAVAIAFNRAAAWAITWAGICVCLQFLLLQLWLVMRRQALTRGRQEETEAPEPRSGLTLYTDTPNYSHTDVLCSGWWHSTTADALMVGRQAYGYVVWQHGTPLSLRSLLHGGRPASPVAAQVPHLPDRQRDSHAQDRESRQRTEDAIATGPGTYLDDSGSGISDVATSSLEQPAEVLALQRSGTGAQSLTFVVFRDRPTADWDCAPDDVKVVDLDPGRLAPVEDISGVIGIFVGLDRSQGPLPIGDHPVTMVLKAAEHHRLTVLEIQLPIPAPEAAYADLQWTRLQLGLQDGDIKRLKPFLSEIQALIAPASSRPGTQHGQIRAGGGRSPAGLVVGVQTVAEGIPRILNPRPAAANPGPAAEQTETTGDSGQLVMASDLDIVATSGLDRNESPSAKTWRFMAICADWRTGIESELLGRLDPQLDLVGLTVAILHGKAVLLLLAHRRADHDVTEPATQIDDVSVYLGKWQSRLDLGIAERHPLLRVHMRSPDRPGATLEVLESLRETLHDIAPESLGQDDWNVWYARVVVAHGNVAQIQLTVRLEAEPTTAPPPGKPIDHWGSPEFSKIERQALTAAAQKLATARRSAGSSVSSLYAPEDTVISVGLVKMPELDPSAPRPEPPAPRT